MQQNRRKQLENYFYNLWLKKPLIVFTISFFLFLISGSRFKTLGQLSLIVSLCSLAVIGYQLFRYFSVPDDESVDAWLADDISRLVRQSYDKVGISPSEKMPEPLVIISPVYWFTRGIGFEELGMRKGKDKMLRFSVYHIAVFHLDEYILAFYRCDYNFLRGASLNEATNEYHYKDVVSVATVEASSNFRLPDGQKFVHFQEFRLSVASGESIRVTLNPQLLTNAHRAKLPPSGADRAVSVIRNMLRAKKV